jgi:hypothetical protein
MSRSCPMDEMVKYLKALVFLQLQSVTGGSAYSRPELLLERAGFSHKEIADVLGKTAAAVAKTISRARAAARSEEHD